MIKDIDWSKMNSKSILCVHQGYELYGSDRTFISSVVALRSSLREFRIDIALPKEGDLSRKLEELGFQVKIKNLWIPRKADGVVKLITKAMAFPYYAYRAHKDLKQYEVLYVNTAVVMDYCIAARFSKLKSFVHVHEIASKRVSRVLRSIIKFSKSTVIFNSHASKAALCLDGHIVWNGVQTSAYGDILKPKSDTINILMIGRINSWKGQDLLIQALELLPEEELDRIRVRIVGSAFENTDHKTNLLSQIMNSRCSNKVLVEDFRDNPGEAYHWADLVVVPSKKPEPFGLVAIEAMAHNCAVIAAGHGGLMEIIKDNQTGLLFKPNSPSDLMGKIEYLIKNEAKIDKYASAAKVFYKDNFTEHSYKERLMSVVLKEVYSQKAVN